MVDWVGCAHEEDVKFFTDSDRVDRVRFVEVPWDTPVFPGVSVIYPATNDPSSFPFPDSMVGTRRPEKVKFTGARVPKGLFSGHFCGSLDEHDKGSMLPTSPAPVAADGWPRCCNPPFRVGGGGGAACASVYTVVPGGPVAPGLSCATAGVLAVGQQGGIIGGTSGAQYWWRCPVTPGGTYHLDLTLNSGFNNFVTQAGPNCSTLRFLFNQPFTPCVTLVTLAGETNIFVLAQSTVSGSPSVLFTIHPGAC